MNIAFDAKRLFNNYTGLGNYSRTLVESIKTLENNNNYILFTPKVKYNAITEFFTNCNNFKIIKPQIKNNIFWRSFQIKNDIKKNNIDVFHGLSNELPFGINKLKTKSIVTIHDLIFLHYPKTYPFIDRKIYDLKFKLACNQSDIIVSISNSTKIDLINFYGINPDKIKVIYQSCNEIFKNEINEDYKNLVKQNFNLPKDFILSVGSIIERKNLMGIAKSYLHLKSDERLPIVIVGKGKEYKNRVLNFIYKNKIEKYFIWLDNIESTEQLQAIYSLSKCLIYPSFYEGFGIPIIEAMLCKTPVITSNCSSLPEAAGGNAILINPLNPEEIANAIKKIVFNNFISHEIKENAFNYVKTKFDKHKIARDYLDLYKL